MTTQKAAERIDDMRNIENGWKIPSEGYCDQPYIVKNTDGDWLCFLTTGAGEEGQHGQHIVTITSSDQGRTWSEPMDIEPADGPEASWALPLVTPQGRIYVFYNYNKDNIRQIKCNPAFRKEGSINRVDSLGVMAFRYSDDNGRSWSKKRYEIPIRKTQCDFNNEYGGEITHFWGVGKPIIHDNAAYIGFAKVGKIGIGFMEQSEGFILKSENILYEDDPDKLRWQTLPEGDRGLVSPGGPVSDETNLVGLSDGSLYCTYRTIDGHPCHAYSRDGGVSWTPPAYMTYTPGGRRVKHPRAANFVWKCTNGKYLYWFHNHGIEGGRWVGPRPDAYRDRNPVWLSAGTEHDGPDGKVIHWSQPEIALYHDDPLIRTSYPSLVEELGTYFLVPTEKETARVHELPAALMEMLFHQETIDTVATDGLLLEKMCDSGITGIHPMPTLPIFNDYDYTKLNYPSRDMRAGLTLELAIEWDAVSPPQVVFDSRSETGVGLAVRVAENNTVELEMCDGRSQVNWRSDPDTVNVAQPLHIVMIVDGGPKIIRFVVNGQLQDGGNRRQFGWGRFPKHFYSLNHSPTFCAAPSMQGRLTLMRIYERSLFTTEAIANYRTQCGKV